MGKTSYTQIDLDALERDYPFLMPKIGAVIAELRAIRGDRDRLRNLLQRYGQHKASCEASRDPSEPCLCGWAEDCALIRETP